jgi:hypothetical protein
MISISWGDPDDGKTIEHEANPEPFECITSSQRSGRAGRNYVRSRVG